MSEAYAVATAEPVTTESAAQMVQVVAPSTLSAGVYLYCVFVVSKKSPWFLGRIGISICIFNLTIFFLFWNACGCCYLVGYTFLANVNGRTVSVVVVRSLDAFAACS